MPFFDSPTRQMGCLSEATQVCGQWNERVFQITWPTSSWGQYELLQSLTYYFTDIGKPDTHTPLLCSSKLHLMDVIVLVWHHLAPSWFCLHLRKGVSVWTPRTNAIVEMNLYVHNQTTQRKTFQFYINQSKLTIMVILVSEALLREGKKILQ